MSKLEKEEVIENENSKETNRIKYIILLIVATLFGFLVGFGLTRIGIDTVDKGDKNEVLEDDKKDEEKEIRELTETEKGTLLYQIETYNEMIPELYGQGDINLTDQELLQITSRYTPNSFMLGEDINFTTVGIENVIRRYFNVDREIQHTDIMCDVCGKVSHYYDSSLRAYKYDGAVHGHGGGVCLNGTHARYLSGSIENESEIVVKTKILYGRSCSDICGPKSVYYGTYEDAMNNFNVLLGDINGVEDLDVTDEMYESVADKLVTTVFTFVKDSLGNYGLKAVTFE